MIGLTCPYCHKSGISIQQNLFMGSHVHCSVCGKAAGVGWLEYGMSLFPFFLGIFFSFLVASIALKVLLLGCGVLLMVFSRLYGVPLERRGS